MASEKERLLEEAAQRWGIRYGLADLMAEIDREAVKRVNKLVVSDRAKPSPVDWKTRRLIIIAALVHQQADPHQLQVNMRGAIDAGATQEELLELINILQPWVGYVSRNKALEAWRQTFRPDIPTINRVIEAK